MSIALDMLDGAPRGPWMIDVPMTTTLVLVGADDELTGIAQGLAAAIADVVGAAVDVDRQEETPPDVPWIAAMHVPGLPAPLLCWPEDGAVDGTGLPEHLVHRHGLVVQTILHPSDPLTCLVNIVRLLGMIDPAAPGLLDADTGRWLDRALLERAFLGESIEPPEDVLWVVESSDRTGARLLRSRGLGRCGRRELQVGPVDEQYVDVAADLVASIAALSLETALPEPGVPAEIGPGLHVHVAAEGEFAAIVDPDGSPPLNILTRLGDGVGAVYRTDRSARRARALAQATWSDFLDLVSMEAHECLVEVPFEDPTGQSPRREHVWMRVARVVDAEVDAEPVHEPLFAVGIESGTHRIAAAEIASWRVIIEGHAWGPEQVDALLAKLRS